MISVDDARSAVLGRVPTLGTETVPLFAAASRVLRAPVVSDRDLPPFNRAAMDGFAVRSLDAREPGACLNVVGDVRAGTSSDRTLEAGEAFRIMTGAPVPEGADAVIQVERTRMAETSLTPGSPQVLLEVAVTAGQNIVPRGSEAGSGATLLPAGLRLGPAHLAVLASVGVAAPLVSCRPRVAVIVTGDEVVDPEARPNAAQIRNANGPALVAAVTEAGGIATDFGVVPDDPEATTAAIRRALDEGHAAIVLSGGVSAGDFDFVEPALGSLGVTLHITAVRVKPGAPFVFGTRGDTLIFGLPGNPVSAQVTFELFVRPALLKLQGATAHRRLILQATLEAPLVNKSGRRNYLPVAVSSKGGSLVARPIRTQGSGDIVAHALANALAVLEPDQTGAEAGERIALYPLADLIEV